MSERIKKHTHTHKGTKELSGEPERTRVEKQIQIGVARAERFHSSRGRRFLGLHSHAGVQTNKVVVVSGVSTHQPNPIAFARNSKTANSKPTASPTYLHTKITPPTGLLLLYSDGKPKILEYPDRSCWMYLCLCDAKLLTPLSVGRRRANLLPVHVPLN